MNILKIHFSFCVYWGCSIATSIVNVILQKVYNPLKSNMKTAYEIIPLISILFCQYKISRAFVTCFVLFSFGLYSTEGPIISMLINFF